MRRQTLKAIIEGERKTHESRRQTEREVSNQREEKRREREEDKNLHLPATLASMILSSVFEEKAEEEEADPLLGSCTRRVVGSVW